EVEHEARHDKRPPELFGRVLRLDCKRLANGPVRRLRLGERVDVLARDLEPLLLPPRNRRRALAEVDLALAADLPARAVEVLNPADAPVEAVVRLRAIIEPARHDRIPRDTRSGRDLVERDLR